MKKTILLSLCCIGTIIFAACGQTTTESDEKIQTKETERITESTANTEIDTGLTTEVPESVIDLYEQSIAEASHQNVLKIIVDTFENDDKYYAFALTGPNSVLPYTGDRYEYYEDTHVWFMSENGAEEVKYDMPHADVMSCIEEYVFEDGTKVVYTRGWESNVLDYGYFYSVNQSQCTQIGNYNSGYIFEDEDGNLRIMQNYFCDSQNGETSYSESDVEIVDGKIEFANSEQIVHN